jgi:hypothetical protein
MDGKQPQAKKAEDGGRAHQRQWALWQCVVGAALVVLVLALAHAVACCTLGWPRGEGGTASSGEQPRARKAEAAKPRLESYYSWKPRSDKKTGSSESLASSGLLSASWLASDASLLRGACLATTLCPQLVVPEDCTLQCALPRVVCRRRQNLIVSVSSLVLPSETVPLQARLAEGDSLGFLGAGIKLEVLGGEEELAFLSTEDVWASKGARQPEMEITRVSGAKYATIKKTDPSTYVMARGAATLMVFSGRFSKHELQVCCASGQTVARVSPGSTEGMYEVVVYTNTDAGLIILGLLGIDKVEIEPTLGSVGK